MNDPASLQYLSKWDEDICLHAPKAVKFLIANKCDLEKLIPAESMDDFVAAHNCEDLFIVSAKTGSGIEDALQRIGEKLLDIFSTPMFLESQYNETVEINKFVIPSKSCCS
ncbi:hypothetical protein FSP39_015036 [Pinctada imbricata]|uniref:Uncharacterized protein n=1 Tax=Pinctada imbricata TaxID=66713 RepID=A0AA89BR05_PINIB|nr:hypothetical protein FSP39_015036 [Pinctada imbricata]